MQAVQPAMAMQAMLGQAMVAQAVVPPVEAAAPVGGVVKRRSKKLGKNGEVKRQRSKKAPDAPRRPKSAYMFFLAEFREQWKKDNPESKKVSEVAKAAGDKWREMGPDQKAHYEQLSTQAKSDYKEKMVEYDKDHPRPLRRQKKERDPAELKRPQSAYFFFLADFREQYKLDHPGEPTAVSVIGKAAGEKWKSLTPEEKAPYETMSQASKDEYARLKTLTPSERVMVAAAARMQAQTQGGEGAQPGAVPPQPAEAMAGQGQQVYGLPGVEQSVLDQPVL